jgi:hypothetical protein
MISRSLVSGRLLCRGWTGLDTQVAEQGGHVGSEMFAVLWEPGGGGSSGLPDPRRLTRQRLPRREPGVAHGSGRSVCRAARSGAVLEGRAVS